ncbi:hypothetical protein R3P38DRAFT_2835250 [Favolaschia claudopus]|uniref:F-box domain-containing protein n=1 Tax=Favolaschia claudopus TaxID=2862362 RepID=A0AAW0EC97_9AGAR
MSLSPTELPPNTAGSHRIHPIPAFLAKLDAVLSHSQTLQVELTNGSLPAVEFDPTTLQLMVDCRKNLERMEETIREARQNESRISRIPREILSEIFRFTLSPGYTRKVNCRDTPIAAWRLGHVSRYWRDTAQTDPALWCAIVVDCRTQYIRHENEHCDSIMHHCHPSIEYPLDALERQIHLSRHSSLSVNIHLAIAPSSPQELHHLEAIFNLLLAQSQRWMRLTLEDEGSGYHSDIFNLLSGACGHLDRLQYLCVEEWGTSQWSPELSNTFLVAPNLREVSLHRHLRIDNHSSAPCIPWCQLTSLRINAAASFLQKMLKSSENLVDLALESDDFTGGIEAEHTGSAWVLPRLRRLSLHGEALLVESLSAPSLEYLELNCCIDGITDFIRRSRCHLQDLKLLCPFVIRNLGELPAIVLLLQSTPHLSHLELEYDDFGGNCFDRYTRALTVIGDSTLCPKLSSFQFDTADMQSEISNVLCTMLESRWSLPTHLRSLQHVLIPEMYTFDTNWDRLEALRADGMDIAERDSWDDYVSDSESEE